MIYMHTTDIFNNGFAVLWTDVHVERKAARVTSVTSFHTHPFYEINLILSGDITILLENRSMTSGANTIVLTGPGVPHYITCKPETLYDRIYVCFTHDFVSDFNPEWPRLSRVFGQQGAVISLTQEQTETFKSLVEQIGMETSSFRQRLLIFYLLSVLSENASNHTSTEENLPTYITNTLAYLNEHYAEKITAEQLAAKMYVGRTTLMIAFKRHIGYTLGEYLTRLRLRHAAEMLLHKETLDHISAICGFSDSSGLIRSFKKYYGCTPGKYTASKNQTEASF